MLLKKPLLVLFIAVIGSIWVPGGNLTGLASAQSGQYINYGIGTQSGQQTINYGTPYYGPSGAVPYYRPPGTVPYYGPPGAVPYYGPLGVIPYRDLRGTLSRYQQMPFKEDAPQQQAERIMLSEYTPGSIPGYYY